MTWLTRRRIELLFVVGLVVLVGFHRPLLRQLARPLITENAVESADTLLVVGGDRIYSVAAEVFQQHRVGHIVLLSEPEVLLTKYHITEPRSTLVRRELMKRGVPEQAIEVDSFEAGSLWDVADWLHRRLAANQAERVSILANRFSSTATSCTFAAVLSNEEMARVSFIAIPDRRYDESNWWRSRSGIKELLNCYVRLIHITVGGRPPTFPRTEWDEKAFERRLLAGRRAAP